MHADISIHAPLAGSDYPQAHAYLIAERISIHAPLAGSDPADYKKRLHNPYFNPRSPCGERQSQSRTPSKSANFNPRSPCGERRFNHEFVVAFRQFQSTLPLRGATYNSLLVPFQVLFQSTLPLRGATLTRVTTINICNFNPRSPCGERQIKVFQGGHVPEFQSTLPLRGATRL